MRPGKLTKDQSFIYRYPRATFYCLTTSVLLIFFSRPIYDLFFFDTSTIDLEKLKREHKSRFAKD